MTFSTESGAGMGAGSAEGVMGGDWVRFINLRLYSCGLSIWRSNLLIYASTTD